MSLNIIKEVRNDLLKRKEVVVSDRYGGNPGFDKSMKDLATHFKVDENNIVIRKIGSGFGDSEFLLDVFVYDSAGDREKIEPKKKEKKAGK